MPTPEEKDLRKVTTTSSTTKTTGGEYKPTLINSQEVTSGMKPFEESQSYTDIMQAAQDRRKALEAKYNRSKNNAKWAAWTNLAQALGQIGGLGKATPQKIDNSYFNRAMQGVDKYNAMLEQLPSQTSKELQTAQKTYNEAVNDALNRNLRIIETNTNAENDAKKYKAQNDKTTTTTKQSVTTDPIAEANLAQRIRSNDIAESNAGYNKSEYTTLNFKTGPTDEIGQHQVNKNVLGAAFDAVMGYFKGITDADGISLSDKINAELGAQPDEYSKNYYMGKTIENAFIGSNLNDFQKKELSTLLTRGIRR